MDMKIKQREHIASLIQSISGGGDVRHGVGLLAMNNVQEYEGASTVVTVGNIVMEEPIGGDEAFDLTLCDVYIVPRKTIPGIAGNVCVSEAQTKIGPHVVDMIREG